MLTAGDRRNSRVLDPGSSQVAEEVRSEYLRYNVESASTAVCNGYSSSVEGMAPLGRIWGGQFAV